MSTQVEVSVDGELRIEKGLPIPPRTDPFFQRTSKLQAIARSMEVGDSVLLPPGTPKSAMFNMSRTTGFKFTQRKQPDGSIRVWRIAGDE